MYVGVFAYSAGGAGRTSAQDHVGSFYPLYFFSPDATQVFTQSPLVNRLLAFDSCIHLAYTRRLYSTA